ncbi:MAG TPA: hypothetical protein VHW01_00020, partial [Polyangiaceae bacterium]|nr:hypothetical protein [Polyangiaceae bacterium]
MTRNLASAGLVALVALSGCATTQDVQPEPEAPPLHIADQSADAPPSPPPSAAPVDAQPAPSSAPSAPPSGPPPSAAPNNVAAAPAP